MALRWTILKPELGRNIQELGRNVQESVEVTGIVKVSITFCIYEHYKPVFAGIIKRTNEEKKK